MRRRKTVKRIFGDIRALKGSKQGEAILRLASRTSAASHQARLHLFGSSFYEIRSVALEALVQRGGPCARIAVQAAVTDSCRLIRCEAVEALTDAGTPLLNPKRLIRALQTDKSWFVRSSATESLGAYRGKKVRAALLETLQNDVHPIVRRDAAQAISFCGKNSLIPVLEQVLENESEDQARLGLFAALYRLGKRGRLADLLLLLHSSSPVIRHATVNTLQQGVLSEDRKVVVAALKALRKTEESSGIRGDIRKTIRGLR